eukprot:gb/GFBE01010337.1/.p1 GENE.gb/GFBE01010337.1/~~gb/GFBE01010337.1/.p1  ORF type:complete len:322 (+),score=55.56 gb/GFBE01010337.1/:1-966(+)
MQVLTLLEDAQAQRFLGLSLAFIGLLQFSCIVEEYIFVVLPGFKGFFWTVALAELVFFALSAVMARWKEHGFIGSFQNRQAPLSLYAATALVLGLAQGLGKVTNRYLNYATGTIVKSSKLVPTLLISVLWLRRSVSPAEWVAATLLVSSSALMALGEQAVEPNFNPAGLGVAAVQLFLAALQGNLQERALKDYGAPISEAMALSNSLGIFVDGLGAALRSVGIILLGSTGADCADEGARHWGSHSRGHSPQVSHRADVVRTFPKTFARELRAWDCRVSRSGLHIPAGELCTRCKSQARSSRRIAGRQDSREAGRQRVGVKS